MIYRVISPAYQISMLKGEIKALMTIALHII